MGWLIPITSFDKQKWKQCYTLKSCIAIIDGLRGLILLVCPLSPVFHLKVLYILPSNPLLGFATSYLSLMGQPNIYSIVLIIYFPFPILLCWILIWIEGLLTTLYRYEYVFIYLTARMEDLRWMLWLGSFKRFSMMLGMYMLAEVGLYFWVNVICLHIGKCLWEPTLGRGSQYCSWVMMVYTIIHGFQPAVCTIYGSLLQARADPKAQGGR